MINAEPLLLSVNEPVDVQSSSSDVTVVDAHNELKTFGIVIWARKGFGEVLTSESFEKYQIHFVFTPRTEKKFKKSSEALGIGSFVYIRYAYESQNFTEEAHQIVYVDSMTVCSCAKMSEAQICVVFNPLSNLSISVAHNEDGEEVIMHATCKLPVKFATQQAAVRGSTEFIPPHDSFPPGCVGRMLNCFVVIAPFGMDAAVGSMPRPRLIVLEQISESPMFEDIAVITKIMKPLTIEARYLVNDEAIHSNYAACQSQIIDKLRVGSLVCIRSTPTFPSSMYTWRGIDISPSFDKSENGFVKRLYGENRKIFTGEICSTTIDTERGLEKRNEKWRLLKNFDSARSQSAKDGKKAVVKKEKSDQTRESRNACIPLNTAGLYFKKSFFDYKPYDSCDSRHILLLNQEMHAKRKAKRRERRRQNRRDDSNDEREDEFDNNDSTGDDLPTEYKSPQSIVEGMINSLDYPRKCVAEPAKPQFANKFALMDSLRKKSPKPDEKLTILSNTACSPTKSNRRKQDSTSDDRQSTGMKTEDIVKLIAPVDGIAKSERFVKKFVLPDTHWKPNETRFVGLKDNFQWIFLSTFVPFMDAPIEDKKDVDKVAEPEKEPILPPRKDGFWYRRTVPRTSPAYIVAELIVQRNVAEDCDRDLFPDDLETSVVLRNPID